MTQTRQPKPATEGSAQPPALPRLGRQGPATFLALVGVLWFILAVIVVARWVTSGSTSNRRRTSGRTSWRTGG